MGLIASRRNFKQLEDFNTKGSKEQDQYTKDYMDRMAGRKPAPAIEDDYDEPTKRKRKKKGQIANALEYIGCYGSENKFSDDKEYNGGPYGSNVKMVGSEALKKGKKFVAMTRVGMDGHSFIFDHMVDDSGSYTEDQCAFPCADAEELACGCADHHCGGLSKDGEEHLRRWAVYKFKDEYLEKRAKKKKKKKKK